MNGLIRFIGVDLFNIWSLLLIRLAQLPADSTDIR